jgi:hypothetical protein
VIPELLEAEELDVPSQMMIGSGMAKIKSKVTSTA